MKNCIVTTTIFNPSIAIRKFSKFKNWKLIVVGDLKTPHHLYRKMKNIIYLSPKDQINIDKKLSDLIGWNCIQRRNFGYLYAYRIGAKFIASVDDDNLPYSFWNKSLKLDQKIKVTNYKSTKVVFDPLSIFKFKEKIWHRGYPIQLIDNKKKFLGKKISNLKFDIQANLWNKDPDIDAINRISLKNTKFKFNVKKPYTSDKIMPFNSQNTILAREVIKDYFVFPFVGRMDDIWASYYVQSIGKKVFFDKPTVYQDRNLHNLYKDFLQEVIGYKNNLELINSLIKNPKNIKNFLPKRSYSAFKRYKSLFKI